MVVEIPQEAESSPMLKDVLFACHSLGMSVRFIPISEAEDEDWVTGHGKDRYIVTLLARKITARKIAAVSRIIADNGLNIDHIIRRSGRISLFDDVEDQKACVELSVRG